MQRLLAERGLHGQRADDRARGRRHSARAHAWPQLATVRVETAPGDQLQIDFGQKRVQIAGAAVRVFLLVAVLSYSRRLFVKAFLNERQDDWREGIAAAFTHFGGVPRTLLGDNARALVLGRDRATGTVQSSIRPIWPSVATGTCSRARARPYRARTKGKTEAGVKYVKRNGAGGPGLRRRSPRSSSTWRRGWSTADQRDPRDDARSADRSASTATSGRRCGRCRRGRCRGASSGCAVASRTMPSSTSTRCATACRIASCAITSRSSSTSSTSGSSTAPTLVATHARSREPFARVVDPAHFAGLWRPAVDAGRPDRRAAGARSGRDLADYAAVVADGGQ